MRAVFFGDVPNRLSGAQRSLLASLSSIREVGVEPTIVFPSEGIFVTACREAGLPVRILPAPPAFSIFGRGLMRLPLASQASVMVREALPYSLRLARLIDEERAEVVHFNTARGAIMAGMATVLSSRPAVLHVRGFTPVGRVYWLVAEAFASWFVLVARFLERELLPSLRGHSRVVHNGVNVLAAIPRDLARGTMAARWHLPTLDSDTPIFLSLSSLVPYKGLHHLLDAAVIARTRGINAHFVLAGTGLGDPYEAWLRRRRQSLGLTDRVHFVGFVDDPREALSGCDALILPSVEREILDLGEGGRIAVGCSEGLPRGILEAMAVGLPVIATRMGGVLEQIEHERNGLLIPSSDPLALADAIGRVAGDPAWREDAGRRGREIMLERFSIAASARGLADVLRLATSRPNPIAKTRSSLNFFRDAFAELAKTNAA